VKLVVIYGTPGVGKLTTAEALAALTGFRLFHNHLSFNLVKAIFDFPSPPFGELAVTIRLASIEAAARARLPGLIFTYVYANPEDDSFIGQMVEAVERQGGEVLFVRLSCDAATNERRVVAEERRAFGKIATVESLRGLLTRWNLTSAIAGRDTLDIDNSALSADAVARRIAEHFSLPILGGETRGGVRS
jgi:hypothetical protein